MVLVVREREELDTVDLSPLGWLAVITGALTPLIVLGVVILMYS